MHGALKLAMKNIHIMLPTLKLTVQQQAKIATSSNALMLIPQNDLSSVKITVTYSTTNDNGKVFEGTKEATLTGTWDIGKKILYTLTLPAGAEELTFTAQADGWTNEDPQPSPIEPNK